MDRTAKEQVLGEIKEQFANVASIVIADYRGITVPVVTAMRDDFRKAGCHYRVLKNSLVFTLGAVGGSLILGLATALLLNQPLRWRNGARAVIFAPIAV